MPVQADHGKQTNKQANKQYNTPTIITNTPTSKQTFWHNNLIAYGEMYRFHRRGGAEVLGFGLDGVNSHFLKSLLMLIDIRPTEQDNNLIIMFIDI